MNTYAIKDNKCLIPIVDAVWPVGSVYISTVNKNPSEIFGGGTWTLWGEGRVPVGVDTTQEEFKTVEQTGGEKEHKLTVEELAKHTHSGTMLYEDAEAFSTSSSGRQALTGGGVMVNVASAGKDQPHNNLQPYITCYMWKRTA